MKLQRGKFLVKNIDELKNIEDKRIIDLAYMGKFEYEGNTIPISRMFIEFYMNEYLFYPTKIYNKNGEQMHIYANSIIIDKKLKENPNFIEEFVEYNIHKNITLWDYINHNPKECIYDFWWNVESNYFIFFGEEKIDLINYFINECYYRDGGKENIKSKLLKKGYKL